jgi:hypothetical protein
MEHLGRFTPRVIKDKKVMLFRDHFQKIVECLSSMLVESSAYKNLILNGVRGEAPVSIYSVQNKQQEEEETHFR